MVLAVPVSVLLGACGGSSPQASETPIAHPSAAVAPVTATLTPTTSQAPAAGPTRVTVPNPTPANPGAMSSTSRATSTAAERPATTSAPAAKGATSALEPKTPKPAPPKRTVAAWAPASPQSSPALAGWALLDAWVARNRSTALKDADPAAVSALFAYTYPGAGVQYRGCSSPPGNAASNCVYRDGNDLLSLTVSPFPHGWAVTGAVLES